MRTHRKEEIMFKVKVSYSLVLTFPTLEDAERAMETLFEGGVKEVTIAFEPIEEAATSEEA
jgi:hypothetical protein